MMSSSPFPAASPRRGFTLVELLIVVALIALLVAMLLPTLGRAKDLALSARCKANLAQAWTILHGDTSQRLAGPASWASLVAKRGDGGALRCPVHSLGNTGTSRVIIPGGDVREIPPPGTVVPDEGTQSDSIIYAFVERENYALPVPVHCDITEPGYYDSASLTPGIIPAWTTVDSYFLFFDPVAYGAATSGSITFGAEILGIICLDDSLDTTDVVLGRPGTEYPNGVSSRGYEMGTEKVTFSNDRRTLTINNYHSTYPGEHVRILTAQGVASSYAMNPQVAPLDARPGQILLLDFDSSAVDLADIDPVTGLLTNIALRHLDKANGVLVDGSVHSFTAEDLHPDSPLWKPSPPTP